MKVTPIKTKPIVVGDKLFDILDESLIDLKDKSIVAITSNIVSICEKNLVKIGTVDKETLIKEQAEYYLPPDNKYHVSLTIKNNILIPSAGIDESNANGYYTLWPKRPQQTVDNVRQYLKKRFHINDIGVIIVDSKTTPLRWGVTGVAISHSGFLSLNDYTGTPDIFGRLFVFEKANIVDALAVSAVVVMGEGKEQTPIAIIEDTPFVHFQDRNPTKKELDELHIELEDDLYATVLKSVKWRKG